MPVMAICFIFAWIMTANCGRPSAECSAAAAIELAILLISVLTGTANSTYAENTGLSGWVIDSNRCFALSIIFAVLAMFSAFYVLKGKILGITLGVCWPRSRCRSQTAPRHVI